MTTLVKIAITGMLTMLLLSCNFPMGVKGNGNVITTERTINSGFDAIEINRGIDVFLTQSDTESVTVEADENLHDIIKSTVKNNTLKIYADTNIGYSKSKKVHVNFKAISKIKSTSGSHVMATNFIKAESLELETSSGSHMSLEINAETLNCELSSGSQLNLTGKTNALDVEASSGSHLRAGNLQAQNANAKASSGANILINTANKLYAKASSGGNIEYYGTPQTIDKSSGVSGNITEK